MASDRPSSVTQLTQEVRLATTFTGGVSLAIWMAGVTREINLLAQASQCRRMEAPFPSASPLSAQSAASLTLYAKLIDLLDVVVDVDILSGTSAGGINAALLASSRVTGADLGGLRGLWLDLGALLDLIRDPTDKITPSLLYGDKRMFAALAEQIPKLATGPFPPSNFQDGPRTPSTTLYVTTTLLTGETSRFTDSFGTLVQDVDRRGVFTFVDSQLAQNPTALALAARSSASFPLAFEPSFIPFTKGTDENDGVPARPPMAKFANTTRAHWVADGGLLDNQPIDVLLRRIFDRPARRAVRRVLLFVVPSSGPAPKMAKEPPPDDVDKPLSLIEAVLKDLAAAMAQSIAGDLKTIRAHQDRMDARTDATLRLAELAVRLGDVRLLTPDLLADYRKREATRQAQTLATALLRQLSTWPPQSDNSTESIPTNWEAELAIGGGAETSCRRRIIQLLEQSWVQPLPEQPLPLTAADLARYGESALEYAKGSAITVLEVAHQLATAPIDIRVLADLTEGVHQAASPPEPIDLAALILEVCTNANFREGSLTDAAAEIAARYLLRSAVQPDAWQRLGQRFVEKYDWLIQLAGATPTDSISPIDSILGQDAIAATSLTTYLNYLGGANTSDSMALRLFDLAVTQRAMLPAGADIDQPLEFVQVSADTRSLFAPRFQTAQDKLTGMQFHHFGAFYKRSWRANDWMWGRLDGAGWLVHVLLDPRRVHWIANRNANDLEQNESRAQWFVRQLKELGAQPFPAFGFTLPPADDGSEQQLTEDLVLNELRFLDDASSPVPPSLPRTSLWLARAWQQLVLDEELDVLAQTVLNPNSGPKPDRSPKDSQDWAKAVLDTPPGDAKYQLLDQDPVAKERFESEDDSPLMKRTIAKAVATAAAALRSVPQLPPLLKPAATVLRGITRTRYRVTTWIRRNQ
jgi:patatin-related protein